MSVNKGYNDTVLQHFASIHNNTGFEINNQEVIKVKTFSFNLKRLTTTMDLLFRNYSHFSV